MAVGFGLYLLPTICTLLVVIALITIRPLEARLFGKDAEANILAEDDLDQDG